MVNFFYTVVQPGKMMILGGFGIVTHIMCQDPSRIHAGRAAAISALFTRTLELCKHKLKRNTINTNFPYVTPAILQQYYVETFARITRTNYATLW